MSSILYAAMLLTALGCWLVAGGTLYLVGTIRVTIARNVQLNERLAKLHPRVPARRTTGPNTSQR